MARTIGLAVGLVLAAAGIGVGAAWYFIKHSKRAWHGGGGVGAQFRIGAPFGGGGGGPGGGLGGLPPEPPTRQPPLTAQLQAQQQRQAAAAAAHEPARAGGGAGGGPGAQQQRPPPPARLHQWRPMVPRDGPFASLLEEEDEGSPGPRAPGGAPGRGAGAPARVGAPARGGAGAMVGMPTGGAPGVVWRRPQ
jgi:translation initiation factor IF-2